MKTLAIDIGRSMGWALQHGVVRVSGVREFRPGRHVGAGMEFVHFQTWLDEFRPLDRLYYEEVRRHLGTDAAHVYGAFWGHLTAWCSTNGVPFEGVPVGTIKKFCTGKGNADKRAMIAAVNARWFVAPNVIEDDNEADAIALLEYAKATLVPA